MLINIILRYKIIKKILKSVVLVVVILLTVLLTVVSIIRTPSFQQLAGRIAASFLSA